MLNEADTLTVDEDAFMDGLRIMYFLNKPEIAHTTFKGLKYLCELLGKWHTPEAEQSQKPQLQVWNDHLSCDYSSINNSAINAK